MWNPFKSSPEKQLKKTAYKLAHNMLLSGFGYGNSNASHKRKTTQGWLAKSGNADQDITFNLETLRQRSRDLFMSGGLPNGALKKLKTSVVGSGLKLNSQIDYEYLNLPKEKAEKLEAQIEREFKLWAENSHMCDTAATNDFYDMQALSFLSMLMSGDCFVLLPSFQRSNHVYSLKMQLIESDRVNNLNSSSVNLNVDCLEGVELDNYGCPIAYHISSKTKLNSIAENVRVEAFSGSRRNVLHLFECERPDQRRGVPILSPVLEQFKQLTRYSSAELTAAVISALFTVFVTRSDQTIDSPIGQITPPDEKEDVDDSDTGPSIELGEGLVQELEPGQKIEIASSSRPNAQFDTFTSSIIKQIGISLEIPYEVLIQHFSASYSASRGALLQAWIMFQNRRDWLVKKFCQPIYEEWMTEAVLNGRLRLPGFFTDPAIKAAYCRAEFFGSAMPQIDPVKEVNAATSRVEQGFSTRERETSQLTGMNFSEIAKKRPIEEELMNNARKITNETNVKYGNQVKNAK